MLPTNRFIIFREMNDDAAKPYRIVEAHLTSDGWRHRLTLYCTADFVDAVKECERREKEMKDHHAPTTNEPRELTGAVIARRCTDMRLADGEFSGGRQERCQATMTVGGVIENTCGEPCRWIMQKGGHGSPPWP